MSSIITFIITLLLSWLFVPTTVPVELEKPQELPYTTIVSDQEKTTSQEKLDDLSKTNGTPYTNTGELTDKIAVYSYDARPVDGSYECVLYNIETFRIYAEFIATAGDGSPVQEYLNYYSNDDVNIKDSREHLSNNCI